jgi:hypothetical protein
MLLECGALLTYTPHKGAQPVDILEAERKKQQAGIASSFDIINEWQKKDKKKPTDKSSSSIAN